MNKPKKHHIVPQMLLTNFCSKGKICVYSKKRKSYSSNQCIKNVCVQNYYYGKDYNLEGSLAGVESSAAAPLQKFKKDPNLISAKEKESIAKFLSHLYLRTEFARNLFCELERNTMENSIINYLANPKNLRSQEDHDIAGFVGKNGFKDFNFIVPQELRT